VAILLRVLGFLVPRPVRRHCTGERSALQRDRQSWNTPRSPASRAASARMTIIALCNEVLICLTHDTIRAVRGVAVRLHPPRTSPFPATFPGRQPGPGRPAHRSARGRGHRPGPASTSSRPPPGCGLLRACSRRERQPVRAQTGFELLLSEEITELPRRLPPERSSPTASCATARAP